MVYRSHTLKFPFSLLDHVSNIILRGAMFIMNTQRIKHKYFDLRINGNSEGTLTYPTAWKIGDIEVRTAPVLIISQSESTLTLA